MFRPHNYPLMVHPDLTYAWINLPKNASSFTYSILHENNWKKINDPETVELFLKSKSIKKMAILRDPLQRWISGFAETFGTPPFPTKYIDQILQLLDLDIFWEMVYKNPVFCPHTELQHRLVNKAVNFSYIPMQERNLLAAEEPVKSITNPNKFYKDLTSFIRQTGGESNFQHWTTINNPVTNEKNKLLIFKKIYAIINDKENIKNLLLETLRKDYKLIENSEKWKQ